MSQYRVMTDFTDLTDNTVYRSGDLFPLSDIVVSKERLAELSTNKNRRGIVLIEKIEQEQTEDDRDVDSIIDELPNFNVMTKSKIIEFGQDNNIDNLNMQMTKKAIISKVKEQL